MRSARAFSLVFLGLWASGCHDAKAPEAPPASDARAAALAQANDLPGAKPLDLAGPLAKSLKIQTSLLDLLPYGPQTPVVPVELADEDEEPRSIGIAFSVREDAALLTVRLLRRELARDEATKGVFVYRDPMPTGPGRARISLLFGEHGSAPYALGLAQDVSARLDPDAVTGLLDAWHEKLDLALVGIGSDWVAFDIARKPDTGGDLEELAEALAWLTVKDEDEEPDDALVERLTRQLRDHGTVRLLL